jgi:uncharacterized protein YwqG
MGSIQEVIAREERPAVHLVAISTPSKSHLGGVPRLPSATPWPEWKGNKLGFLARISLPELQSAHTVDWLPQTGALVFFYDAEQETWGFDPNDKGGWAVLHVPDLDSPLSDGEGATSEDGFPHINVGFRVVQVLPNLERTDLSLSDEEEDAYFDQLDSRHSKLPKHQISGYPYPMQGDCMELECQLVSNGLYCGDPSGYNDPRAEGLTPCAKDWRLLLQLDSDESLDVMWGDCGLIYFWVRADEAAKGNFDNAWLILQCS